MILCYKGFLDGDLNVQPIQIVSYEKYYQIFFSQSKKINIICLSPASTKSCSRFKQNNGSDTLLPFLKPNCVLCNWLSITLEVLFGRFW